MDAKIKRHGLFFVLWGLMAAGALIFHLFSAIPASGSSIGLEVKPENRTILVPGDGSGNIRSEEHTSELQSHSFISYAVFCLKKKNKRQNYFKNQDTRL